MDKQEAAAKMREHIAAARTCHKLALNHQRKALRATAEELRNMAHLHIDEARRFRELATQTKRPKVWTVVGHWTTIRQAVTQVKAKSAREALDLAIEESDWIGDNEECDDSDGPTTYEVIEGVADPVDEPDLIDPANPAAEHAETLRNTLCELLNTTELNLDELEDHTRLAIALAGAVLKLTREGPRTSDEYRAQRTAVEQAREALRRHEQADIPAAVEG